MGKARFVQWDIVTGHEYGIENAEEEIGQLVGDGFTVVSMSLLAETEYVNGRCGVLLVSPVDTLLPKRELKDWEVT